MRKEGIAIAAVLLLAIGAAVVAGLLADPTGRRGSGLGKEFSYDLEELRKTPPELIRYDETGRIETGFREARGVALGPEGRIYVAGDGAVRVFDGDGERLAEIESEGSPRCLAVAGDGTVYVGTKDRVEVYGSEGARKAAWDGPGPDCVFTSVAVSGSDVFVADAGNRVVLRYDASGALIGRIGERDEEGGIPGFVVPSPYFDLAVAAGGILWVANPGRHLVEAYTFDGEPISSWGRPSVRITGFCGCCNPTNFALFPDGRFVTSEKGLPRVKVYDAGGEFECVVAGTELFAEGTVGLDLAVDPRERILVLDPVAKSVRVFEARGKGR